MTTEPVTGAAETDPNDWDHHWEVYGEAAEGNPANIYRRNLILKLLGNPPAGAVVLDIGSGQGEFARHLHRTMPELTIWGVEYSAAGVARASAMATAEGSAVSFRQADLLQPVELAEGQPAASYAVCSEVLEHVDDPVTLMRNARSLLAPGCRVVITVPGGPRSAFDRHIGHYQHFTAAKIRGVLSEAGYEVDRVLRAGFPFFNIYKLAVVARGKRLIADVENKTAESPETAAEKFMKSFFGFGFRNSFDNAPLGWQIAAVAHVPHHAEGKI